MLRRAELRSLAGAPCVLRGSGPLAISRDGVAVATVEQGGLFRFDTERGATYEIAPFPPNITTEAEQE